MRSIFARGEACAHYGPNEAAHRGDLAHGAADRNAPPHFCSLKLIIDLTLLVRALLGENYEKLILEIAGRRAAGRGLSSLEHAKLSLCSLTFLYSQKPKRFLKK
jgi:hypothetical protein